MRNTMIAKAAQLAILSSTLWLGACGQSGSSGPAGEGSNPPVTTDPTPSPAPTAAPDSSDAGISITGRALKGPFAAGTEIRFDELNGNGSVLAELNADSMYESRLPWAGLTRITVTGQAYDEVSGDFVDELLTLTAVVDVQQAVTVNINILTSLVDQRMQALVDTGLAPQVALQRAIDEIADLFFMSGVDPAALSFVGGEDAMYEANVRLALLSYALGLEETEGAPGAKFSFNRLQRFSVNVQQYLVNLTEATQDELTLDGANALFRLNPFRQLLDRIDPPACSQAFQRLAEIMPESQVIDPCADDGAGGGSPFGRVQQTPQLIFQAPAEAEGDDKYARTFTGMISPAPTEDVKVIFETRDGTATADSDYEATQGELLIPAGEQRVEGRLTILGDTDQEPTESFELRFSSDDQGVSIVRTRIDVILINDDGAPISSEGKGFSIDEFALTEVLDQGVTDTDGIIGGGTNPVAPLTLRLQARFSIPCEETGRPDEPCANPRPSFEFRLGVSNGGSVVPVTTVIVPADSVNYPGVSGFDDRVYAVDLVLEQSVIDQLLGQQGLDPLRIVGEAVVDDGETATQVAEVAGPRLYPYFSRLNFGGAIAGINSFSFGSSCGNNAYLIQGSGSYAGRGFGFNNLCVSLDPAGGRLIVNSGSVALGALTLPVQGFQLAIDNVFLSAGGVSASSGSLVLPRGVLAHTGATFIPQGVSTLKIDNLAVSSNLSSASGSVSGPLWISSEGLPVVFQVPALQLGSAGLSGTSTATAYLHGLRSYEREDTRSKFFKPDANIIELPGSSPYLQSNDIRWSAPDQQVALRITGVGLDVPDLGFGDGRGGSHFPQAQIRWSAFAGRIVAGDLSADAADPQGELISLYPRRDCGDCVVSGVSAQASVQDTGLKLTVLETGFGSGGAYAATGQLSADPTWGRRLGDGRRIFTRADQGEQAIYVQPGFLLPGSAATSNLAAYLLGSQNLVSGAAPLEFAEHFVVGSDQVTRGNHFFAGINFGPQIWRDERNQPVAGLGRIPDASQTRILLGGAGDPSEVVLTGSIGNKYWIRRGGLTGVFHGEASDPGEVYGYPMGFSRFAFQVAANQLQPYTWIDGVIDVPGDAGLKLEFESLAMNCDGTIDAGLLAPGACQSADPGPNCGLTLAGWNARTEVLGMRFTPLDEGQPACVAQGRLLELEQVVDVAALDRPLQLTARWTPLGQAENAQVRGSTYNTLDRSETHTGFSLALGSDVELLRGNGPDEGWFEFAGATPGLPFWQAPASRMRLGNATVDTALPSLLAGNLLPTNQSNQSIAFAMHDGTRDWDVAVTYEWGATGFSLDPAVYYASGGGFDADGPQFLGRTYSEDLVVLSAQAGVDYIRPELTQMSFGASADFTSLRNLDIALDLNVDLLDPESLNRIDDFFARFDVTLSLADTVAPIVAELDPLAKYTGPGLETLVADLLETALEELVAQGLGADADPFEQTAQAFARLQSVPAEVVSLVADPLQAELDRLGSRLDQEMDQRLADVMNEIVAQVVNINKAIEELQSGSPTGARVGELQQQISDAREALQGPLDLLVNEVRSPLDDVYDGLVDVQDLAQMQAIAFAGGIQGEALAGLFEAEQALGRALNTIFGLADDSSGNLLDALTSAVSCDFLAPQAKAQFGSPNLPQVAVPGVPNGADFDFESPNFSYPSLNTSSFASFNDPAALTRPFAAVLQSLQDLSVVLANLNQLAQLVQQVGDSFGGLGEQAEQALENVASLADNLSEEIVGRIDAFQASDICNNPLVTAYTGPILTQASEYVTTLVDYHAAIEQEFTTYSNVLKAIAGDPTITDPVLQVLSLEPALAQLDDVRAYISSLDEFGKAALDEQTARLIKFGDQAVLTEAEFYEAFNNYLIAQETQALAYLDQQGSEVIGQLSREIRTPLNEAVRVARSSMTAGLHSLLDVLPSPSAQQLRQEFVNLLLQSDGMEDLLQEFNLNFAEVLDEIDGLTLNVNAQLNLALREAAKVALEEVNNLLADATAPISEFPMLAADMDGFAVIRGEELHRAHLDAAFAIDGVDDDTSWGFGASLDVESWNANGKARGCADLAEDALDSLLDVRIAALDLPFNLGGSDITARRIELGFTLNSKRVNGGSVFLVEGLSGLVDTSGVLDFQAFQISDMAAAAGIGRLESYLGATAAVRLDSVAADAAFLVGRTCNFEVLETLDPEAADFVDFGDRFDGAFIRAGAEVPIWDNGCALTVGVGADAGGWVLNRNPVVVGGVFGGAAFGELGCIASLRGQVTTYGELAGDRFRFRGEGFGVAGAGIDCDPGTWTTVERSRRDDWCGTGDAQFSVTYSDGWDLGDPSVSAIH